MAIFRAKNCSRWPTMVLFVPQVRYLGTLISFYRYQGLLDTKIWKKWRNINISGNICGLRWTWEVLKSYPKAQFWCSLCPGRCFVICQRNSKSLLTFLSQSRGSKMALSKICHLSAPIPYWKWPYLDLILAGISHLLFSGFNAFYWPTG